MLDIVSSSLSQGLLWSIMAIGVYVTFRLLHIADLSAEGTFPLGGAVAASLLSAGWPALAATLIAWIAGMLGGLVGGFLHTKMKIPGLFTGILVLTGLYSVNLHILGRPNVTLIDIDTVMRSVGRLVGGRLIASMVVGQYYMSQIYDKLGDITDDFAKIADFQNIEYKGKVYALIAEVQKASTFQLETMENNELRNRELLHLKNLEHECAELLGQANLTIQRYAEKKVLDYDKYEKLVGEAQLWLQYQQTLLGVMRQIADLSYALNLGAISRENSFALLAPYAKQATAAQGNLIAWHEENQCPAYAHSCNMIGNNTSS